MVMDAIQLAIQSQVGIVLTQLGIVRVTVMSIVGICSILGKRAVSPSLNSPVMMEIL